MPRSNSVYSSITPPRRGLTSAEQTPEWIHSSSAPSASRSMVSTASPSPRRSSPSASSRLRQLRSEEHTSELQSRLHLVCRLLLEKKKKQHIKFNISKKQKKEKK